MLFLEQVVIGSVVALQILFNDNYFIMQSGYSKKQSIHQKNQIPFPVISIKHCLGFLTINNLLEEPAI